MNENSKRKKSNTNKNNKQSNKNTATVVLVKSSYLNKLNDDNNNNNNNNEDDDDEKKNSGGDGDCGGSGGSLKKIIKKNIVNEDDKNKNTNDDQKDDDDDDELKSIKTATSNVENFITTIENINLTNKIYVKSNDNDTNTSQTIFEQQRQSQNTLEANIEKQPEDKSNIIVEEKTQPEQSMNISSNHKQLAGEHLIRYLPLNTNDALSTYGKDNYSFDLNETTTNYTLTTNVSTLNHNESREVLDKMQSNSNGLYLNGSNSSSSGKYIDKKNDNLSYGYEKYIPKRVILSWKSITIRAESIKSAKQRLFASICRSQKRYETILSDVRGIVEPGEMLALMGSSGSGKTTLLNALSFSSKGSLKVDGKIMINGCEADATKMAMVSRYIQQEDLFFGTLTVKEHLIFHAMLRMDKDLSREAKMRRVRQVLKEFNLEKRANVKIGIPGRIKGISGGEKRRLTFASEILTDPSILFCDEPTSGLDSYMAKSIVYYLQKMTQNGKTIVCTIHQPSSEIFAVFDKICILAQSRVAYFGPRQNGLEFFTNSLHKECPLYSNPADFYMDVLGVDVSDPDNSRTEIIGYCEVFNKSEYNQQLTAKIENVKPEFFSPPSNYSPYNSKWSDQMYFLIQRSFLNYFRNHKVVINDLAMVFLTALLGGLIYYHSSGLEDGKCTFNQHSAQIISFALFYSITISVIFSILNAVMVFPIEIPIYLREHSASVYRSDTYYISKLLNEFPIYVILPAFHSVILYSMARLGCDGMNFSVYMFSIILISQAAYSLGHILSVIAPDPNFAVSLAAPVIAIEMLFSGFFLNKAENTPHFLTYIKYVSIFNYGYDLLMINQWENITQVKCEYEMDLLCLTSGESILNQEKIDSDYKAIYLIMLLVLMIAFRVIAFLILWFKGHRNADSFKFLRLLSKIKNKVVFIV